MSAAANKKLVQQIYTDSANRSGTTFADNLAEDAVWIVTGQYSWSRTFTGKQSILNDLHGHVRSLLVDPTRTIAHRFIAGDGHVVVEAHGNNLTRTGYVPGHHVGADRRSGRVGEHDSGGFSSGEFQAGDARNH